MKIKHIVLILILVLSIVSVIVHQIWPDTPSPIINIETNIGNKHETTNNYYDSAILINPITPDKIAQIISYANIDTARIPDGYFIAFQRMSPVIIALIQNNFDDIAGIRPDISVGNTFDAYIKKIKPETYGRRIECTHLYNSSQIKQIPIMCYPMELASEFDSFLHNIYLIEQFPFYLAHLQRIKHHQNHR